MDANQIKKAWKIRKEASVKFNCKVSVIDWSECLKMAGEEAGHEFDSYSLNDFYSVSSEEVESYLKYLIERKVKTSAFYHICTHFYQKGKWVNNFRKAPYSKKDKSSYFSDYYATIKNFQTI